MICEQCPFGKLVQTESFIWMVDCIVNDCLMARADGCFFPETIQQGAKNDLNHITDKGEYYDNTRL